MNLPDQLQSALGSTHALPRELGRGGITTVYRTQDHRLAGAGRAVGMVMESSASATAFPAADRIPLMTAANAEEPR
jgi:hypothetical protein